MTYGLPIAASSAATRRSASTYSARGASVTLPSLVTKIPIVEWSRITLRVPVSAASSKDIFSSLHGVSTIRVLPSPSAVAADGIIYPTQSISLTFAFLPSPRSIVSPPSGTNLGCVVMTAFPSADCGSSSVTRLRRCLSSIPSSNASSANFLMKVDLPVLTGPTTPI